VQLYKQGVCAACLPQSETDHTVTGMRSHCALGKAVGFLKTASRLIGCRNLTAGAIACFMSATLCPQYQLDVCAMLVGLVWSRCTPESHTMCCCRANFEANKAVPQSRDILSLTDQVRRSSTLLHGPSPLVAVCRPPPSLLLAHHDPPARRSVSHDAGYKGSPCCFATSVCSSGATLTLSGACCPTCVEK
jgi:hypothetical protein